jgi:tetratricopeptide (TPR) repeat protein
MGDLWLQLQTHSERDRALLRDPVEVKMIATDTVGYEELIRRDPSRTQLRDDVAVLYLALDRPLDAVRHFDAVARLKPQSAPAHFNLATALTSAGQLDEAMVQYRQALALQPSYALAHNNLGAVLLRLNRPADAAAEFRETIRLDPGNSEAHLNLGSLLRVNTQSAAAIAEFRAAVRAGPDSVSALAALASMLGTAADASLRSPAEAVRFAERAAELTSRQDASTLDVLAAAYAAAGDFARASAVADEALALNPPAALAVGIRTRQDLYRQGRMYTR